VIVNRTRKGPKKGKVDGETRVFNPLRDFEETRKIILDGDELEKLKKYLDTFANKNVDLLRSSIKDKLSKVFEGSKNVGDLLFWSLIEEKESSGAKELPKE
jgi:hypothetical protein